jgi:hypothetical protein
LPVSGKTILPISYPVQNEEKGISMRLYQFIFLMTSFFLLQSCFSAKTPRELKSPCVAYQGSSSAPNDINPCIRRPVNQGII